MSAVVQVAFSAAAGAYGANAVLGLAVATDVVSTSGCRWIHHALFTLTSVLAAGAVSSLLWSDSPAGWLLLPAAVPLVWLARQGSRPVGRHAAIALAAAPVFVLSLILAGR
ncbi:MAG: hypothetical protein ACHP7K_10535 [Actinomycetales bacterium]